MTRKSGLHKKVSSIFGDSSIPEQTSTGTLPVGLSEPDNTPDGSGGQTDRYPAPSPAQSPKPSPRTSPRPAPIFDEDREFEASQRKKLYLVIALAAILGGVLYFFYFKPSPQNTTAVKTDNTNTPAVVRNAEISWPNVGEWPSEIRDPMARKEVDLTLWNQDSPKIGKLELRGIISGSLALIGTEIYSVGDKCEEWTVKEILKGSVILEKPDGEKLELKMPDKNRES